MQFAIKQPPPQAGGINYSLGEVREGYSGLHPLFLACPTAHLCANRISQKHRQWSLAEPNQAKLKCSFPVQPSPKNPVIRMRMELCISIPDLGSTSAKVAPQSNKLQERDGSQNCIFLWHDHLSQFR